MIRKSGNIQKNRKKTVKTLAWVMITVAVACLISSCGLFEKPSEEEIRKAMEDLLPVSYEATYIVYGPGLEIDENFEIDPSWTTGAHYAPISPSNKYRTVNQIRELVRGAFSEKYSMTMYEYAFSNSGAGMSRYAENNGTLTINVTKQPMRMATDIYPETVKVISGSAYSCTVEVEASFEGEENRRVIEIQMLKEGERWVFDGPSY